MLNFKSFLALVAAGLFLSTSFATNRLAAQQQTITFTPTGLSTRLLCLPFRPLEAHKR